MIPRLTLVLLALWLFTAPILFGAVAETNVGMETALGRFVSRGGGFLLFRGLGALCMVALFVSWWAERSSRTFVRRRSLLLLLALPVLALLQRVPLPRAIHSLIAPAHAADLALLLPGGSAAPISVDPGWTLVSLMLLGLLVVAAGTTLCAARKPASGWVILGSLTAAATLGAGYGFVESSLMSDGVFGFAKPSAGAGVTGTFFYRGHFAAFTAMALGIAAAGMMAAYRHRRPLAGSACAVALAILAACLLISHSRAGLLAGAVALCVGLTLRLRSRRWKFAAATAVCGAVVIAGLAFGAMRERIDYLSGEGSQGFLDVRLPAWGATLELVPGRPVFGCGFGAFRRAIHLKQWTATPQELYHAHSDLLQLLAEGGLAGFLLVAALLILLLRTALRLARSREAPGGEAATACLAGLAGLGVMAMGDFPLRAPALALSGVVLLFLPLALTSVPETRRRLRPGAGLVVLVVGLGVASVTLHSSGATPGPTPAGPSLITAGEKTVTAGLFAQTGGNADLARRLFEQARDEQPFEGATRYHLAEMIFRTTGDLDRARPEYEAAHHLARGRASLLFRLGIRAYRARWPWAAEAFKEAAELEPRWLSAALKGVSPELAPKVVPERAFAYEALGAYWIRHDETDKALEAWWKALELGAGDDILRRLANLYRVGGREDEGRQRFAKEGRPWSE